jgi:hypothetical protein
MIQRAVKRDNELLKNQKNITMYEIPLLFDQFRYIEYYDEQDFKRQATDEFGGNTTGYYIIYFDFTDRERIKKGDYVYFNRSTFMQKVSFDPLAGDIVRLEIKEVPQYSALTIINQLEVTAIAL